MRRSSVTKVGRVVAWGSFLLPLVPAWSQQTSKPQSSTATRPSSGVLDLSFGPTASNAEGKAAATAFLQAMGGATKVNAVKSLNQSVVALRQGKKIDIEQIIVYPDKQAQRMSLPQGRTLLVITPDDAFTVVDGQARNLAPAQRSALDATLKHDFINVLQHINDPKYIFSALGREKIAGVEATIVDVEADGIPTRWWIAPDGKLLQERYSDMTANAAIQTMSYSDWKNFDGLQYPTKYELFNEAGQPQMSMTLIRMEVNTGVDPRIFHRPSANQ
jgi:hypothetical protein